LHHSYESFRNNQQDATMYYNLLFQRFLLLNMFRATHRSSSGAQKLYLQPLVLHTSYRYSFWAPGDERCFTRSML